MEQVYSVSVVNSYIKNLFARDYALTQISVKGEVSNCKYHMSGHIYFTLKDSTSQISCVMFAMNRRGLNFKMTEGQSVVVTGSISVYERDGRYQLYAKEITREGVGNLYEKYERLKKELEQSGYFEQSHKKQIPLYAKRVGIATASTGAAVQDIINIATRRNPYIELVLYPTIVQGDGAKQSIVKAIRTLDKAQVDVIIVGRGGGSIEDLWGFNEEVVAKAIYECKTPIISAVGHETDTTIADYVADLRAPTPSAAAELAVCNIRDLMMKLSDYQNTMNVYMGRKIADYRNRVKQYETRLGYVNPLNQVKQRRQRAVDLEIRLGKLMEDVLKDKRHRLAIYIEKFNGLSPLNKLNQGYALVTNEQKENVTHINQVDVGEEITVRVVDGDVKANVTETKRRNRMED